MIEEDWIFPFGCKDKLKNFALAHNIDSVEFKDNVALPVILSTGKEKNDVMDDMIRFVAELKEEIVGSK